MAGVDVVVVPEADLYQGVVVDRIYKIYRMNRIYLVNSVNPVILSKV